METQLLERDYIHALMMAAAPKRVGRVLTIPHEDLSLERKIIKKFPEAQVIGITSADKNMRHLSKDPISRKMSLSSQNIFKWSEHIERKSRKLDFVWLDFRVWLGREQLETISNLLRVKALADKCMFAISTTLNGQSQSSNKVFDKIAVSRFKTPMSMSEVKRHILPTLIAEELRESLYRPILKANITSVRSKSVPLQIIIFKLSAWTDVMSESIDHDPGGSGLKALS